MIYSVADSLGRIVKKIESFTLEDAEAQLESGEVLIEDDLDHLTQYIIGPGTVNQIATRPTLSGVVSWNKTAITADGSDAAIISNLPLPATYEIIVPEGVDSIDSGEII